MSRPPLHRASLRGMTLVEVMVGVAIGLIAMIVMFQTITVWDQRTRVSSAGSDAQVTGTVAMYNLERDLRLAGMGFGEAGIDSFVGSPMGCTVSGWDGSASAAVGFPLRGVSIVDHTATSEPDEIATLYGNSAFFNSGGTVTSTTAHSLNVKTGRVGFKAGDLAVVTGPTSNDCKLIEVTDDATAADYKTLRLDQTSSYPNYYKAMAVPSRYNTASGVGATTFDGGIFSLGPLPHRNSWRIVNGVLGFSDDLGVVPSAFFPVADGVVDLKAFYGYDADNDGRVADSEWTKSMPPSSDWRRVRAVKVFLLLRSKQFERPANAASTGESNYLAPNPTYVVDAASGPMNFQMKDLGGTTDSNVAGSPTNWRYYRYVVYEKIVPVRNLNWPQPVAAP